MAGNNLGVAQGAIKVNTSDLKNADLALRSAGDSMLNFGMQAVGAFAMVVNEAAKFEKEMDFVQAVTNASAEEMKQLENAAIDLAKNSVYGPIELSKAFVELAKAGATVEQIVDGVGEAAVNLATAADVEIPFAGENLINILNTFKLGAEDATRVADLLAGAANASSIELEDLVTTMRYAGPVASAMGIPIEDLNDALTILGKVGIKGSTAGTSLRFMMTRLVPDTVKAKDALRELGFTIGDDGLVKEFTNADGSLRSLAEIMQELQDRTRGLNDQQKIAAINDIFGVRAMPSVLELLSQGEAGFAAINDEINRTTAADVAAKRMDNLDGSIKRLKATLSAMFVEAGGPFQQMLKGWVDGLREFLLFIDALPGPLKTFIVGAVGVIGVMSIFAGAFLLTIGNIVRMVRVVGEIKNALSVLTGITRGAAAANSALSASFLANPITLIILAIIALIVALVVLYKKWKPFRDFVNDTWDSIKEGWEKAKEIFNQIPEFMGKVVDKIKGIWDGFTDFWYSLWSGFSEDEGSPLERIAIKIHDAWVTVVDFFKGIPGAIGGSLSSAYDAVVGFFTELPGTVKRAMGEFIDEVKLGAELAFFSFLDFLSELPRRVGYALGFVIGRWIRFNIDLVKMVYNGGKKALDATVKWLADFVKSSALWLAKAWLEFQHFLFNLPHLFFQAFLEVLNFLIGIVPQITSKGAEIGLGFVTALVTFLQELPGKVLGIIAEVMSFLTGFGGDALSKATEIGWNILNGIFDIITDIPGKVWEILNDTINQFKNMVQTAYNAAKDFASGLWEGFKDGLGINSPSFIEEAMYAIQEESKRTVGLLANNVRKMGGLSTSIPATINSSQLGLTSPAAASGTSGFTWQQNGPLIGQATVRSQADIYSIARELEKEQARKLRAKGVTASAIN